ncbi:hypothetical protein, partial [Acinetobacter baumannii]|uniref:hypothetical protein n=1 Tax=Acinetobacter baumannii TaxID=470 RepID=UPI001BB463A2
GIAKLVKALDFDSSMRRFESFFPSHLSGLACDNVKLLSRYLNEVPINSFAFPASKSISHHGTRPIHDLHRHG